VRERSTSPARRAIVEGVAELLERKEFKLLEAGVRMAGGHVVDRFPSRSPSVRTVTVSVATLNVPTGREVSKVSVEATYYR
jgi:dihydroneopterin aldolase